MYIKDKPRKDSLVEFFEKFGSEDKRIEYFINMNYPAGYVCDHCGCHEYYLIKRKGIKNNYVLECAECGHQVSILRERFEGSNLSLLQLLIGLYVFFTNNSGVDAPDLANYMDISPKSARKYAKKFRILMAESNNEKKLDAQFYETDIIEYGGKKSDGARGKGADKQQVLLTISTGAYNRYSLYIKLHALPNHKAQPIKDYLTEHVVLGKDRTMSTDKDKSFMWLKDYVNLRNDVVDYDDPNHKMYWLNIFASNFENNIKFIYKKIRKRDLPLYLAEQKYRTNHRYTGKHFLEKMAKYIHKSTPITNDQISKTIRNLNMQTDF